MFTTSETSAAIRDAVFRATAVVGLAGVALIHVLNEPATFHESTYMAWLFVGLILGSIAAATALATRTDTRVWTAATLLQFGAIAGYVISRTVGLPQSGGDIGNWSEPLGLASLFVEGSVVALGAAVLLERVPRRDPVRRRTHETLTHGSGVS